MTSRIALLAFRPSVRTGRLPVSLSHQALRCRSFSNPSSSSFSAFEYPLRTEAPIVTRTTASSAATAVTFTPPKDEKDVFDDSGTLSELERSSIQNAQKNMINTTLQGSQPIMMIPPDHIPPNMPASQLEIPTTQISTLPNGIRVVSQETYGQMCSVGVLVNTGSRLETTTGTSHVLELTSFQSSKNYESSVDVQEALQTWGGNSFCHVGREQALWCVDILRPNVEHGCALLKDIVLHANYTEDEVAMGKLAIGFQWEHVKEEKMPVQLMSEALQRAAFGVDQQLGKPHLCPIDQLDQLDSSVLREFMEQHVHNNPKAMVISGAGIGHDELVDIASRNFGHLQQRHHPETSENIIIPSVYQGGEHKIQCKTKEGFTQVAIGFPVGGWRSEDLVPTCVLQTLLLGGSSFSQGGPGKGMYSRLYRQVLNKYHWSESAEAFTTFHEECGIFGISGSSLPEKSVDMAMVIASQLLELSVKLVSDEEFDRATRMLKSNVLTQLESRLVLFEDMGRQVLTFGYREDSKVMAQKIDNVTKEDLMDLVKRAVSNPPTLAAVGDNVDFVPTYEEVKGWFKPRAWQ